MRRCRRSPSSQEPRASRDAERPNRKLVKVTFVTDWKAQAEHGGFYQAVATGLYAKAGLDVTIKQGGPSVNTPQLIAAGAVDFAMGSNHFQPLNLVAAGADALAVAAIFQKDPQVLITHPRDDIKSIADMKGKPIMLSDATVSTWWIWAKSRYGFNDKQIRKYTFNLAPFLTDTNAIQQGYVSSEPFTIETQGKIKPKVFLLADYGYPGYSNFIIARGKDVRERPKIVQAFVNASLDGWASYLTGDPKAANDLIKRDNPEMTDAIIAQAIAQFKTRGMVQGGDAAKLGHRRDDGRALENILRSDEHEQGLRQNARLQKSLHDPIREQGPRRAEAAREETELTAHCF